jgi:hypothetical protein
MQLTKSTCWHWPDHTISKTESRQLREEHNRAVNEITSMDFLNEEQEREFGKRLVVSFGLKAKMEDGWSEPRYIVDGSTFTALGVFRRFKHIARSIQSTGVYPQ